MTTDSTNLLVPMNVDALAVGSDSNSGSWILQVPDFAAGINSGKVLGYQQLPPDMWNPFPCPYEQGIHLRWALPDGLTHGSAADATDPNYPEVPNRWFILRLYTDYSQESPKPAARAWIVESDFIAEKPDRNRASQWPVLPTTSDPTPSDFQYVRYVGRQIDFKRWPDDGVAQYLSDLGGKLTAVGYGSTTYAAYYPVCRTVFGFHDEMSDFPNANAAHGVSLTYLVAGWYFDPSVDVLHGYANSTNAPARWQDRMAELKWSWYHEADVVDGKAPPPPSPQPTRTITHGFVSKVNWTGTSYNYGPDKELRPQLAVGNTSLDALAALVAANASGDVDPAVLEKVLLAFQSDLLSVYDKYKDSSAIDRELNELLHEASFGSRTGGVVHEVRRKDANAPAGTDQSGDPARSIALPSELSKALTTLNQIQRELESIASELTSYQEAYFHAWHQRADGADVEDAVFIDIDRKIRAGQTAADNLLSAFGTAWTTADQAVEKFLPDYELSSSARSRYWQPGDFALLVANAGRTFRHGEDGRFSQNGNLFCRVSGSTLTELDFTTDGGIEVKMPVTALDVAVPTHGGPGPSGDFDTAIRSDVQALLLETVLLDPNQAQFLANRFGTNLGLKPEELAEQIRNLQAINWNAPQLQPQPNLSGSKGLVPSPAAVTYWLDSKGNSGNPWIPLMMQWQFDWYPSYESGDGVAHALKGWIFNGTDYELDPSHSDGSENPTTHYNGITVLTPAAVWNLQKRLEDYNSRNPDNPDLQAITELISALSKFDLLSQIAGGANLSLTMRQQSLQLPPISRETGGLAAASSGGTVVDLINKRYETGPWQQTDVHGNLYFPVRAGHVVLTRLKIVDAFGQVLTVSDKALQNPTISSPLKSKEPGRIKLPPRLSQHSRMNFELVSAADDSVVTGADSPTTPICGWLVPDYLDSSLLISSADGKLLGKMQLDAEQKKVLWIPDPVKGQSQHGPQVPIANPHLNAMQNALLNVAGSDFTKFLNYIEQVEETIYPPASQINSAVSALMGSPIAVVRVGLSLELEGLPLTDQSLVGKFEDHGYSEIAFPVALGDIGQPDDGLFGYFARSSDDETDYKIFYTASGADAGDFTCPYIVQPDPNNPPLHLAAYTNGKPASPTYATLLMDPRTKIKLQSGILPATTLVLPPQNTAAVLASHEIFFQVSPVVGSAGTLSLPHPSKKYGAWSWLELEQKKGSDPWESIWNEVEDFDQKTGKDGLPLYPVMLREGWLRLRIPSACDTVILYFAVVGGTYLVEAGTTIRLTWAAKFAEANYDLQLIIGEAGAAQTVPNQSPGFDQTVQATTTYTLCLIDAHKNVADYEKLTVRVS
jgi:hypothetical protein